MSPKHPWPVQFNRFLISGGLNTAFSYAVFLGLLRIVSYESAYIASYILGLIAGYYLNSRWVFAQSGSGLKIALYPLVYVPQLVFGTLLLRLLVESLGIPPSLSVVGVIILTIPLNFLLVRWVMHQNHTLHSLGKWLQSWVAHVSQPKVLFSWFFISGAIALFLGYQPQLEITLRSSGGYMQPIQTQAGALSTKLPPAQRVLARHRTVVFDVPLSLQRKFALDVTSFSNSIQLERVGFRFLGLRKNVPLESTSISSEGLGTPVILAIRVPTKIILLSTMPWLLAAAYLAAFIKLWPRQLTDHEKSTPWAVAWLVLCFSVFVYQVVWQSAWLPLADDWRYYSGGAFSLVNGRFDWLLISGNDTYFLTGQVFDWIMLKISNGNFLSVRVFGLVALAGFLSFATALLLHYSRHFTAVGLIFLSLSMSSSAYWGHTGIAYHQMLPVLFFVWCLWKLAEIGKTSQFAHVPYLSLTFLAFAAGLAYISGSLLFMALATSAIIFWTLQALKHKTIKPSSANVITQQWWPALQTLSVFGAITMLMQISIVTSRQVSLLERSHASAIVFPTEIRFWEFLAALYGRITGIQGLPVGMDLLVLALVLTGMLRLGLVGYQRRLNHHQTQALIIALACGIGGLLYAFIVSAGRAGLGPEDASWVRIAELARARFHYWWLAALLPVFFTLALDLMNWNETWRRQLSITLILLLVSIKSVHMLHIDPGQFENVKERELKGIDCIRDRWTEAQKDKSKRYDCRDFYPAKLNEFLKIPVNQGLQPAAKLFQAPTQTKDR